MKASIIKRMLTGALIASLVMAPAMSVAASSETPGGDTVVEETVEKATEEAVEETTTTTTAVAAVPATSTVAGTVTTTKGTYLATSVNGAAVTTSVASIASGYGLSAGEAPYAKMTNMDPAKSHLAKAAIDLAAASQGGEVGPMINLEFGKMAGGKYSLLSSEGPEIRIALGIPKSFAQEGKTFAMVRVRAGGVVSILPDVDDNPNTITFDTTGGAGAYAIIRY